MDRQTAQRCFYVTASRDIGPKIKKGDEVCIDPDATPQPGKYVLVDGKLQLWRGQPKRAGVATKLQRDIQGVENAKEASHA
jgi:hypothetical protein